jgi:hypothetical protein
MNHLKQFTVFALLFSSIQIQAAPWFVCGNLSQMTVANNATIPGRPITQYEYGIAYNPTEPIPVVVTHWNIGLRITNKQPYMVISDNPAVSMNQGGFVFYSGTSSSDDTCGVGSWRHRYWWTDATNVVRTGGSNGCYGVAQPVYCRLR